MFRDTLQIIKNLFTSKKKKLILDIKKKHNKNISNYDINDYRRKHRKQSDSISDNDILMLILSEDVESTESTEVKSVNPRNTENYSSPHVTTCEYSNSYKSPKSTRNDDNYNGSSDYNSGGYSSGSCSGGGSSSSSDCGSGSSCD